MDLDQLTQRLEWLDNERRKDKLTIATLEERIATLEEGMPNIKQEITDLNTDTARTKASLARFDQIESSLVQLRVDLTRAIEAVDRQRIDRDREVEKTRLADMEVLQRSLAELRKTLDTLPELRRSIQARIEEDFRLSRLIEEVNKKITDYRRSDEDYKRALKVFEENQRQDSKRLADVQGEISAFRKRIEEQRGRYDVVSDLIRKVEARINDLQTAEGERRQAQAVFVDRVSMQIVERDRIWKEWQARFDTVERQSVNLDTQLQTLDATHRSVRRAQEAFDEMTERFERRINEISELQRLTEERFKQEWVGFKAEDQKRWTNYSIAHDEQQKDVLRSFTRLDERLVALEDITQEVQDLLNQITEETQKRLQALLTLSRGWVEETQQSNGRVR
jgi:chromosome segregation ATPase